MGRSSRKGSALVGVIWLLAVLWMLLAGLITVIKIMHSDFSKVLKEAD